MGITPDCWEAYTVQYGDSCASIQGMFAISLVEFYKWNPISEYSSIQSGNRGLNVICADTVALYSRLEL